MKYKHGGMRTAVLILGTLLVHTHHDHLYTGLLVNLPFWVPYIHVAATFGFENMATLALAVNLVTYFNGVMHFELADAANQLTNYMGTGFILSIIVAILADTFFGRFKTLLTSGCFEFVVCQISPHHKLNWVL